MNVFPSIRTQDIWVLCFKTGPSAFIFFKIMRLFLKFKNFPHFCPALLFALDAWQTYHVENHFFVKLSFISDVVQISGCWIHFVFK